MKYPSKAADTQHMLRTAVAPILLMLLVSVLIYCPLVFGDKAFSGGDLHSHYHWVFQFRSALQEGYWYPRWMPKDHYGLGSAIFYPIHPMYYYLTSFVGMVTRDDWVAIKIVAVFANFLTGFIVWNIAKNKAGKNTAIISAILAQFMPWEYFLFNQHEALPGSFSIPILMLFLDASLVRNRRFFAGIAIIVGIMIMTHILMAFMLIVSVGLCRLAFAVKVWRTDDWHYFLLWNASVLAGCLLAMVYVLPALTTDYLFKLPEDLEFVSEAYMNWKNSMAFPLVTSRLYGIKWFSVQWIYPMVNLLGLLSIYLYARHTILNEGARWRLGMLLGVSAIGLFLSSEAAFPLYYYVSFFQKLQFPYRFNVIPSIGIALATPLVIGNIANLRSLGEWRRALMVVGLGAPVLLFCGLFFQVATQEKAVNSNVLNQDKQFGQTTAMAAWVGKNWRGYVDNGGFENECAKNNVRCANIVAKSQDRTWNAHSATATKLVLPVFYLPSWSVKINGNNAKIEPDQNTGLIAIDLQAGDSVIQLSWSGLATERVGAAVSLTALLGLLAFSVVGYTRRPQIADAGNSKTPNDASGRS